MKWVSGLFVVGLNKLAEKEHTITLIWRQPTERQIEVNAQYTIFYNSKVFFHKTILINICTATLLTIVMT